MPGTSQLMLHLHHSRTVSVEPRCLCRGSASRETSFIRNHELRDRKKVCNTASCFQCIVNTNHDALRLEASLHLHWKENFKSSVRVTWFRNTITNFQRCHASHTASQQNQNTKERKKKQCLIHKLRILNKRLHSLKRHNKGK